MYIETRFYDDGKAMARLHKEFGYPQIEVDDTKYDFYLESINPHPEMKVAESQYLQDGSWDGYDYESLEEWLEEMDGIRLMSQCGFRVYESEEFGYVFGIDGAGYDFYESHWIPLYKARGLQWHDPMTEDGKFAMTEWRKASLYEGLLGYLKNTIKDSYEIANILKKIGFTYHEIAFEGFGGSQNVEE